MKFRTEIEIKPSPFKIDHSSSVFLAGSCFAENILLKLTGVKFNASGNPFGIMFNPMSVASMVNDLSANRVFTANDLVCTADGLWASYAHHGSFSGTDPEDVLGRINAACSDGAAALRNAGMVIITFGTAWIFRLNETGKIAANCHKQPQPLFSRERLAVEDVVKEYGKLLEGPWRGKKVVFTVSPVRHLSDGAAENSLSKAILRVAAGILCEKHENALYFPAYEIMNDDLRDYRFYARDMVHPGDEAVDYIWEKFTGWCMDRQTVSLLPRLEKIRAAMLHRPIHADARSLSAFVKSMNEQIDILAEALPDLDFEREKGYFDSLCEVKHHKI